MAASSSKMLQTPWKMTGSKQIPLKWHLPAPKCCKQQRKWTEQEIKKEGKTGKKTSPNNSIPAPLDTVVCSLVVQTRFSVMDPRIQTAKKIYIGILVVISFGHSVSHLSSVINPPSESLRHTLCILGLSPAPTISYIYTILYYTLLYYTILYYTILYYTILYYTTPLHYTILYYSILYYTILYYTKYIYNIYIYIYI